MELQLAFEETEELETMITTTSDFSYIMTMIVVFVVLFAFVIIALLKLKEN